MKPSLNMLYVHDNDFGYGRMGVQIARELDRLGVEVFDHIAGSEAMFKDGWAIDWSGVNPGLANVACWLSVPAHGSGWFEGQIPIVFTMWEGMRLPESFHESFHDFEMVICPSWQNLELFSQHHDNVKFVPLGIDPDVWHFQARKPPEAMFKFLHAGSGARKGGDLVAKAFKKLWPRGTHFGDNPIPTLTFKSPKGTTEFGERMVTVGGKLSPEDEVALYADAHCFVMPSRGEGFGLMPLQAIAQGCPTILTNAHGHESYAHLGLPLGWSPVQSAYFIYGDAGDWWEPNFDDLCMQMEDVYKNYDLHMAQAAKGSEVALRDWTWAKSAEQLIDAIGLDRLSVPYIGTGAWHTVDKKLFKVITKVDWQCEIAGLHMLFKRGTEYWQMADVKRILFEAGILDPACLDDHDPDASGLTDAQIERAGKYRAEHENCPVCGQKLVQYDDSNAPSYDGTPLP